MESKIRLVQYNEPWCVYVQRKRAVQKGVTQEFLGCAPLPYAAVLPTW